MDLIRAYVADEDGKSGIIVVYDDVGLSWNLAEEAAKKLGRALLDQYPRGIIRNDRVNWFFEFKP